MAFTAEKMHKSISQIGPLLPVYFWGAMILDGKKRQAACDALGIKIDLVVIEEQEKAAALLWSLHPERAFKMFRPDSMVEASRLFACPLVDVLPFFRKPVIKKQEIRRKRKTWAQTKQRQRSFRIADALFFRFRRCAARLGMPWSKLARICFAYGLENPDEMIEWSRLNGPPEK